MRIIVTGGRDYGWKWENGVKVPDEKQRQRLNRVLDRAYSEFERRIGKREQGDIPIDAKAERSSNSAFEPNDGWDTSLSLRKVPTRFTLINGGARGADELAKKWGERKPGVIVDTYYAEWEKYQNRAGPIRNSLMLKEGDPDAVVAFPGGRGTAHMVEISKKAGVPVLQVKDDS